MKVEQLRICKRCLLKDMDESKEKTIVYQYISELNQSERASQELFDQRIESCRSCDRLEGATCQACGCFVEARAALRKSRCPYKVWIQ